MGRSRRLVSGAVVGAVVSAAVMVAGPPAFAIGEIDWGTCLNNSTATLSFAASPVEWLDSVQASYWFSLAPQCPSNTTVALVEDTNQLNENPQGFTIGAPAYWASSSVIPTTLSGSQTVTPLRSLPWSVELVNTAQLNPTKILATANVAISLPPGPLPNGQTSLTVTDNSVATRRAFVQAVQTPGATIRVAGNVDLDLSGVDGLQLAPNVQILGDRTSNPLGPRLFTTSFPKILFDVPASNGASHERFSGLRLDGTSPDDPSLNLGDDDETAILIEKPNVEVDHNEIHSWRGVGVSVQDRSNLIDRTNYFTVWIHDNYIHHDQHPTGELIGGGHGGGYGVEVSYGATALVERNVFDYNRHAIAGDGRPGTGYYFYRNLILPHGGVNTDVLSTHIIDMHGTDSCWSNPFASDFGSYMCGGAGEYMDIQYNTVEYKDEYDIKLRGTPSIGMDIGNNAFAQDNQGDAIAYTELPPYVEPTNTYNYDPAAHTVTSCDFDGDGTPDPFMATGQTWWYQSSRLGGRWVYLAQSTATLGSIQLGDVNGDGLCDVTVNGSVFTLKPDVVAGPTTPAGPTDIAMIAHPSNSITVAHSNGDGTFGVTNAPSGEFATWAQTPGVHVVSGDFNGDGRTDIALVPGPNTPWWTTLPVAFANGDGSYTITNQPLANFTSWAQQPGVSVLTGDFNGDGKTDIALTGAYGWTSIPVAFSNGDGTFNVTNDYVGDFGGWAYYAYGAKPVVGDFNHDGKADIALVGAGYFTTIPVAFSNGDGSFTVTNQPGGIFPSMATATGVTVLAGDFNGDGRTDIALIGGSGWTTIPIAFSNGDGTFNVTNTYVGDFAGWAYWAYGAKPIVGDFNGDGKADIALTSAGYFTTIPVAFSNGDGSFRVTNTSSPSFATWARGRGVTVVPGDFNHDGRTDLALLPGPDMPTWTSIPVAFSNGDGTFNITNSPSPDFADEAQPGSSALF